MTVRAGCSTGTAIKDLNAFATNAIAVTCSPTLFLRSLFISLLFFGTMPTLQTSRVRHIDLTKKSCTLSCSQVHTAYDRFRLSCPVSTHIKLKCVERAHYR